VLNQYDEKAKSAYVFNPMLSGQQLLEAIIEDFGLTPERRNKVGLFKQLNRFLLDELSQGNNIFVIIDEAQNMKESLLEELRMLSNLETDKEKLFQIILVGQPTLNDKLNSPELVQLRQRIAVKFHLSALEKDEIPQYIHHRLKVAGSAGDVRFTETAVEKIYSYSNGIPRIINLVCDRALLHGYVKETKTIDETIVNKSISELQ